MNPNYAIGNDFHFEVDAIDLGTLTIRGKIVFNNGDIAVVQIFGMYSELDSLCFSRHQLNAIVGDFDDQYVNKEFNEEYAIIDAETGAFRYQQDINTGEIEELLRETETMTS